MTCWDEINVSAPTPRNTDIDQDQTPDTLSDHGQHVASWLRDPSRSDDGQDDPAVRQEGAGEGRLLGAWTLARVLVARRVRRTGTDAEQGSTAEADRLSPARAAR
jgi:hypothetical protein